MYQAMTPGIDIYGIEVKPVKSKRELPQELAERLGVSRPTIYRLARAGRLRTVKLCGVNRVVLSSLSDFVSEGVK